MAKRSRGSKGRGGRSKKKAKKGTKQSGPPNDGIPRSFVFCRGETGKSVQRLSLDVRRIMEPNTASRLRIRKTNVLKDFVAMAGPLGVTHMLVFNRTEQGVNMRFLRLPRGPTLTFHIPSYSLIKDVLLSQGRPKSPGTEYKTAPLLVLSGFNKESTLSGMPKGRKHLDLMVTMFQNMFPTIPVDLIDVTAISRCVLITRDPDTEDIFVRHYHIRIRPTGVSSKSLRKITNDHKIPSLQNYEDIADFVINNAGGVGDASESEYDTDAEETMGTVGRVDVSKTSKRTAGGQQAVKLREVGPRLTLQLLRINEGLGHEGEVLFHRYEKKSTEEIKKLQAKKRAAKQLKQARKQEQETNVKRKQELKAEHKQKSLQGMERKKAEDALKKAMAKGEIDDDDAMAAGIDVDDSDIDDAEYYRREVGEDPDADTFTRRGAKRSGAGKARGQAAGGTRAAVDVPKGLKGPKGKTVALTGGAALAKEQACQKSLARKAKNAASGDGRKGRRSKDNGGSRKKPAADNGVTPKSVKLASKGVLKATAFRRKKK
eukprot:Clim_evm27s204 gene=Clim_evmTU27s204